MRRLLDAQTYGTLIVLAAFAASEAAASLLQAYPGSALAWYLNLELFHVFEAARRPASPLRLLFGPHAPTIDLVLVALVLAARFAHSRFAVALFSNLAFLATVMLAHAAVAEEPGAAARFALQPGGTIDGVLLGLLTVSFATFAASHIGFVLAILRQSARGSLLDRGRDGVCGEALNGGGTRHDAGYGSSAAWAG